MNIQTKLEEFIAKEGVPTDEELNLTKKTKTQEESLEANKQFLENTPPEKLEDLMKEFDNFEVATKESKLLIDNIVKKKKVKDFISWLIQERNDITDTKEREL